MLVERSVHRCHGMRVAVREELVRGCPALAITQIISLGAFPAESFTFLSFSFKNSIEYTKVLLKLVQEIEEKVIGCDDFKLWLTSALSDVSMDEY